MRPRGPRARISRVLARIADANANRAREGFRVVEEILRLGLEDAPGSRSLSRLRRGVTLACSSPVLRKLNLLSARDAASDPGGGLRPESGLRLRRRGLAGLAAANLRRAQESLRVLEELDRAAGGEGTSFRRLRFQAYEAEGRYLPGIRKAFPS